MLTPQEITEILKAAFFIGFVVVACIFAGLGVAIGFWLGN